MNSASVKVRSVPSVTNPTPRPCTPGRPGTSSGLSQGFSSGVAVPAYGRNSFKVFDSEEPAKSVFDDMITEDYLRKVAGTEDLSTVTSIKLQIDTSYQSLLDIGDMLKRLDHLILDGSKIASVRDLGVGLKFLCSLSLNDCGLSELDGIGMLTSLKELSARDNDIEDVTALALHETIESIDLKGNRISDISVADTLSSCPCLLHLVLEGNSIERAPKYKLVVAAMIPQLQSLDGVSVDGNAKKKVSNGMILEAASAMQLEQEELDDERRMEMEMMGDDYMFFGSKPAASSHQGGSEFSFGSNDCNKGAGESGCSLPNNGSDLTHGSAVVLAGSMASAIRRRRNESPRVSSSPSQEDSKEQEEAHMSTLATLDSAAHMTDFVKHEQYFGEGDITKAVKRKEKQLLGAAVKVKMASSPKASQYRQKQKKGPSSSSLDVNTSLTNSTESSHTPKNLSNPIAAAIISAAHSQNSMAFDNDDDESRPNKSSGVSGTAPAGWASRPLSRNRSRRSTASSRSPSPSTRNNSSAEGRKPPKSPPTWQRNASRPQSTASSGRGTAQGIAGGIAPSAPFKVTLRESNEGSPCASPLHPRAQAHQKQATSGVLPNLSRHSEGSGVKTKPGSMWDDGCGPADSESSDEEDVRGRNQRRGVGPPPSSSGGRKGISAVVKKDNVLRGLLFSDELHMEGVQGGVREKPTAGFSFDYKDDDDDDDEDFATDRKSRHEFMRSEQKERESNKHKQKQMMTFMPTSEPPASTGASRSSLMSSHSQKSTDPDMQRSSADLSESTQPSSSDRDSSASGKQLSDVATRSLGFDLKGSLAAINQWVDDQDSDDEDDDDEEEVPVSSIYGDVWSVRNEMKRATTAQKKILSRDKILGMCTGNADSSYAGTRLTADNLAMNDYSAAGYSYDDGDDDDDESECEENEVMFYDNNVDKTANGLSKSCSLLTIGGFGDMPLKSKNDDDEKKLMSMSLVGNKPLPKASPRAKKRAVKRESSKNSVVDDTQDSRGCTPSTTVPVAAGGAAAPITKSTLESDVRSSPSNDVRVEAPSRRTTKKSTDKVKIEVSTSQPDGAALALSDDQLVLMLSQPPKAVPTLKTKSGFQGFFRGMPINRMRQLLEAAYHELSDLERNNKVKKRLDLLSEVLAE